MVKPVIKKYFIIIFVILISTICLNAMNLSKDEPIKGDDNAEKALPAIKIELNESYISPNGGIAISDAQNLIVEKLKKEGTKGKINSAIELNEITTKETWENIGVQLYQVIVNYAWINSIAIIKNREVLAVVPCNSAETVFLADLDNDSIYEIYIRTYWDLKILSSKRARDGIYGFNVASNKDYNYITRENEDFNLYIDNGKLMAEVHYLKGCYNLFEKINMLSKEYKITGMVILKDNNNKKELSIE